MINPHPPLTGFPITISVLICIAEIGKHLGRKNEFNIVCNFLTLAALVIFPLTYYSGYWGAEFVDKNFNQKLIASHQALAKFFLFTCIPYCMLRAALAFEKFLLGMISNSVKELLETSLTCLSLAILALVIYTSYLGGNLVFEHAAAVTVRSQISTPTQDTAPSQHYILNRLFFQANSKVNHFSVNLLC